MILSRCIARLSILSFVVSAAAGAHAQAPNEMTIGDLLVEHRVAPVGLDAPKPRFSWRLHGAANGLRQTAYQIQVARSADSLDSTGKPLVWDSGWVVSDQSHLVAYNGEAIRSSTPYFWRVRIKNEDDVISPWSTTSRWVTGLLDADQELLADWIGFDQPYADTPHGADWFDLDKAQWICHPELEKGKDSVAFYRTEFEAPADATRVMIGMAVNFTGQFFLNGVELFQDGSLGKRASYLDITPWIRPGTNQLAFRVNECNHKEHSGLIAAVRIEQPGGRIARRFTDETWETTLKPVDLWAGGGKPGDGWEPAKVLGKPGEPNATGQGDEKLSSPRFENKVFMPPPVCLRKEIVLRGPVRFAVLHGTAQGLYDLYVNGQRLTLTGFQPGWTQFEKRTDYVSTDVTEALKPGLNAIGIVLADGWFRGNLLWFGREHFGDKIRFSGQLEVEYDDGARESFRTDPTWKASYGPTLQSDLMFGEIYDARLEQPGWDSPNFADGSWSPVVAEARPAKAEFIQRAHPTEPVMQDGELTPQAITEPKPGVYVVDFGQNFAGWARLKITGQAGQTIYLRFAEDVNPDGTIYTDNLRSVNPADRYICKGGGLETWEPRFTYHGFRYVQIVGLTEKPTKEALTGIVAHSGGPITSAFDSSSPMLNRLYQNIVWSQRSNYFETMTDCPQRDERYGWVGDAYFFMASSAYNQNGASFFTKWFLDCLDTQHENTGNISNGAPGNRPGAGNAQLDWSAAAMVTPWTIWRRYGDTQPIIDHYAALRLYMTQWEKFAKDVDARDRKKGPAPYRIIGDWVSIEKGTSKEFIGRVLGYMLSTQMAEFARLAGQDDDVRTFTDLAAHFRDEVIDKHIGVDGTVDGDTQCAYAYVARLGLYKPEQEDLIRAKFRERMIADHYAVLTGFHGTGNLLQGLTALGLAPEASKTILNEEPPSWGGMVKLGATTIWERWQGKNADGTFYSPKMNSFNHYTFGGCGEWMMGYLVGLREESPGFKIVRVEPTIVPDLEWASGRFESPYGVVSNRWERKDGRIAMRLDIPPNSAARVVLPIDSKDIRLEGKSIAAPPGGAWEVGSGKHEFTWAEQTTD